MGRFDNSTHGEVVYATDYDDTYKTSADGGHGTAKEFIIKNPTKVSFTRARAMTRFLTAAVIPRCMAAQAMLP